MSVNVVTGWTGRDYDALGLQFVHTFARHWPQSVGLSVFSDYDLFEHLGSRFALFRSLSDCQGLMEFIERLRENSSAHGRQPRLGWREKDRQAGYSWRFDAVKFATQLFIPEAAAKDLPDGDILAWLDADVLTFADVPEGAIETLIGDADLCYLGRVRTHSEIGFWAVRLSKSTREFVTDLADAYRTGLVFDLAEWHSAFVFDRVREKSGLCCRNLTPNGKNHVWMRSPLARWTDHLKGKRKLLGRSPERRAA